MINRTRWHPVELLAGYFVFMDKKLILPVPGLIDLLKSRGMKFKDESKASSVLKQISYYRFKGYWWSRKKKEHPFQGEIFFEEILDSYYFDYDFRGLLHSAGEIIEIAMRTKMINHFSLKYGVYWYKNESLFEDPEKFKRNLSSLRDSFEKSKEIFALDYRRRYENDSEEKRNPPARKLLETSSFGTLSRIYGNFNHQNPESNTIAKEMGLNNGKNLAGWLHSISYVRNMVAHHSRFWERSMSIRPKLHKKDPKTLVKDPKFWLNHKILFQSKRQEQRLFLPLSCIAYLCRMIRGDNWVTEKVLHLLKRYEKVSPEGFGFSGSWKEHPLWGTG